MTDIDQDTRRPMMLAVRELLRREVDRELEYIKRRQSEWGSDWLSDIADAPRMFGAVDHIRALDHLLDSLMDTEEPVVLQPIPGFHICHEDGGHVVYGWHFVLLASHGGKIRRQQGVSFHHFRWTAKRAGNAWLKRARLVSQRIARELSSQMEVQR